MPPRLKHSIQSRTIRSLRQNLRPTSDRSIPNPNARRAARRMQLRLVGAASLATRKSSSVAFSKFGGVLVGRNNHVQPQIRAGAQKQSSPISEITFGNRASVVLGN